MAVFTAAVFLAAVKTAAKNTVKLIENSFFGFQHISSNDN